MCTVTIVPLDENGFRLRCNRDERRDRPIARPPTLHVRGSRAALFPVDPASGGTWVGVNDAGLAMALLNRTPDSRETLDHAPAPRVSRGRIIPALLACASPDEILERCTRLDPHVFDRFRLLIVQHETVIIVTSNARSLTHDIVSLSRPIMQTSSSLGDGVVEEPRRRLFQELFNRHRATWLRAQRRFHRHQWCARPDISVMMERADARTVSETVIDVRRHAIELTYRPHAARHSTDDGLGRGANGAY